MWKNTASALVGSARRMFMAEVVELLGWGGQRYVEKTFGWDRKTIRKGQQERDAGEPALDGRCRSGRKKAEEHCPRLLDDIVDILDTTGQTDPTFRSTRIYTPITAREVRRRLLE